MSSDKTSYAKNVNVERRTWDKDAYEAKAKERAETEVDETDAAYVQQQRVKKLQESATSQPEYFQPAAAGAAGPSGSKRAYLKARSTTKVSGIDELVGTSTVVADAPPAGAAVSKNGVGWHCAVCDCYLKDSTAYLDHINGKKHQRALGYSMRVEKEEKGVVMAKLKEMEALRKRKAAAISADDGGGGGGGGGGSGDGFGGGGGGGGGGSGDDSEDEEERRRRRKEEKWRRKKAKKEEKEKEKEEEESGGEEDEEDEQTKQMKAMMGFGNFG